MDVKSFVMVLGLATASAPAVQASCTKPHSPYLKLDTTRDGDQLQMEVRSNICGRNTLMLSVDLVGQKDTDIWIGASERTELVGGRARATIDLTGLPDGEYTADAFWGWRFPQDALAKSQAPVTRGVDSNLVRFSIRGTGTSAGDAQRRENKQAALMGSLATNDLVPVDSLAREFGPVEVLMKTPRRQVLYFKGLDMTFDLTAQRRLRTYHLGRKMVQSHPRVADRCPHGDEHNAWAFFQRAVKERLASPRSADFPFGGGSRHLAKTAVCTWTARSWVEGKTALGGTLRQRFSGRLRLTDGGAVLESLVFD